MGSSLFNKEVGLKVCDGIKKAFKFPFLSGRQCPPDGSSHVVVDRTFYLDGHFVNLYDIRLYPGLTFRALEVNSGDFNVLSQDVKFEVDIPTIGGYYEVVSENENIEPLRVRGTFKIKYDTAIAKGITSFFPNGDGLSIFNMAIDFECVGIPKVTLYSDEDDGSFGPFSVDDRCRNDFQLGKSAEIAEVLWPSTYALIYWIFRDKLWHMGAKIPSNVGIGRHQLPRNENLRRRKASQILNTIVTEAKKRLSGKTKEGIIEMPDLDLMIGSELNPAGRGRFKATGGFLGNVFSMSVNDYTTVHARSQNELVIVGQINFADWKFCYNEYKMEVEGGNAMGKIIRTLDQNEAFITITAVRTDEGKTVKKQGRFKYRNASDYKIDVTNTGNFDMTDFEFYVDRWMSGLIEDKKPVLNQIIDDCLNEVLVDIDLFNYWDELNAIRDESDTSDSEDSGEDEESDVEDSEQSEESLKLINGYFDFQRLWQGWRIGRGGQ